MSFQTFQHGDLNVFIDCAYSRHAPQTPTRGMCVTVPALTLLTTKKLSPLVKKTVRTLHEISYPRKAYWQVSPNEEQTKAEVMLCITVSDSASGKPRTIYSGAFQVSHLMDKDAILDLAFHMLQGLEQHECAENFKYRGRRIYNPHRKLSLRRSVADAVASRLS